MPVLRRGVGGNPARGPRTGARGRRALCRGRGPTQYDPTDVDAVQCPVLTHRRLLHCNPQVGARYRDPRAGRRARPALPLPGVSGATRRARGVGQGEREGFGHGFPQQRANLVPVAQGGPACATSGQHGETGSNATAGHPRGFVERHPALGGDGAGDERPPCAPRQEERRRPAASPGRGEARWWCPSPMETFEGERASQAFVLRWRSSCPTLGRGRWIGTVASPVADVAGGGQASIPALGVVSTRALGVRGEVHARANQRQPWRCRRHSRSASYGTISVVRAARAAPRDLRAPPRSIRGGVDGASRRRAVIGGSVSPVAGSRCRPPPMQLDE